ncbi:hypothetical protein CALCODRAFT_38293 [Calocera cornea HHB12733]|uniref:Uncharacterized protein n=1 Tax=Calocera cornea HHB12733 TaxID=1353952 RepID=A0A165DYB5_9BASI|nr:hypothetical protein CALCODRAFT_38293 [Calocera cornea HHB12733]
MSAPASGPATAMPAIPAMVCACCVLPSFDAGSCKHPKKLYREIPSAIVDYLKAAPTGEDFLAHLPGYLRHLNRDRCPSQPRDGYVFMVIDVRRLRPYRWTYTGLATDIKESLEEHLTRTYHVMTREPIGLVFCSCLHTPEAISMDSRGNPRETCEQRFLIEVANEVAKSLAYDIEVRKAFNVPSHKGNWGLTMYAVLSLFS